MPYDPIRDSATSASGSVQTPYTPSANSSQISSQARQPSSVSSTGEITPRSNESSPVTSYFQPRVGSSSSSDALALPGTASNGLATPRYNNSYVRGTNPVDSTFRTPGSGSSGVAQVPATTKRLSLSMLLDDTASSNLSPDVGTRLPAIASSSSSSSSILPPPPPLPALTSAPPVLLSGASRPTSSSSSSSSSSASLPSGYTHRAYRPAMQSSLSPLNHAIPSPSPSHASIPHAHAYPLTDTLTPTMVPPRMHTPSPVFSERPYGSSVHNLMGPPLPLSASPSRMSDSAVPSSKVMPKEVGESEDTKRGTKRSMSDLVVAEDPNSHPKKSRGSSSFSARQLGTSSPIEEPEVTSAPQSLPPLPSSSDSSLPTQRASFASLPPFPSSSASAITSSSSSPVSFPSAHPSLPPRPSLGNRSSSANTNNSFHSASSDSHGPTASPSSGLPTGRQTSSASELPSNGMQGVEPETAIKKARYEPRRVKPGTSVFVPLDKGEYERARASINKDGVKNPLRGWVRTVSGNGGESKAASRVEAGFTVSKRGRDESEEERSNSRHAGKIKLIEDKSGDVAVVASHYNHRPELGRDSRRFSPIFGLKSFNNWIKSCLVSNFARQAIPGGGGGPGQRNAKPKGSVLEIGCGKGGDLLKWNSARVARYVGIDIAEVSVQQAYKRAQDIRNRSFEFDFHALDCFANDVSSVLSPRRASSDPTSDTFDLVSMQFCMHYAFETERQVRQMLSNVSKHLKQGGLFVGTIPNAEMLVEQLQSIPSDSDRLSFGNSVFSIEFESRDHPSVYGHRYSFFLQDAVEDVPEYLVHFDNFRTLALEYELELVYKKVFHEIYEEERQIPEFEELLTRMKVINSRGESEMTEDQWEAANLYLAFAFEKK